MNTIERRAEIDCPRAQWVLDAAFHVTRQVGPAPEHLRGRRPVRPFLFGRYRSCSRPCEADAADADTIADCLAWAGDIVEPPLAGVDNDRTWSVVGRQSDGLARDWRSRRIGTVRSEIPAAWGAAGHSLFRIVIKKACHHGGRHDDKHPGHARRSGN